MILSHASAGTTGWIADRLVALYPPSWRRRYEEEFRDVLAQCPPSLALVADVCRGAVIAHLTYGRDARRRAARRERARRRAVVAVFLLLSLSAVTAGSGPPAPYRPLGSLFS